MMGFQHLFPEQEVDPVPNNQCYKLYEDLCVQCLIALATHCPVSKEGFVLPEQFFGCIPAFIISAFYQILRLLLKINIIIPHKFCKIYLSKLSSQLSILQQLLPSIKFLSAISNMRPGFCTFIQNSQKVLHAQGFRQAHRYYPADDEICPRSERQVPAVSTASPWNQRNSFWISVSSATEYPSFWQMDSICLFGIPVFGFLSSKYRIFDNN